MDKEKLKLIVKNLKSLVDVLESEVYSDVDSYVWPKQESGRLGFEYSSTNDDDGEID
jgi:hypothetical protein|tara:strand:+ start:1303 stop:1473 length:171 start_codon:yes stop_codon:yes gene_type:complete